MKKRVYYVVEPILTNINRPYIEDELLENKDSVIFVTSDGHWSLREVLGMRGIKFRYCYDILAIFKDPSDSYLYMLCQDPSGDVCIYVWVRDVEG